MPMIRLFQKFSLVLIGLGLCVSAGAQFYNGSHQEFGKNRVQYRDFLWLKYPAERFEVYYYQGGDEIARYVVRNLGKRLAEVESVYDFPLDEKLQIIVYNKQSEFRQSNVGIVPDDRHNIGGATRIVGSKIFIYYESDHPTLDRQLRAGLSEVLFNQMMYGGDWKDAWKSSTLMALPEWFTKGIVSFAAGALPRDKDAKVRDMILAGKMAKFNRLTGEEAVLAGHAFWAFIEEKYGRGMIPNILYMTRISRNIENGFVYVLQKTTNELHDEFLSFMKAKYMREQNRKPLPEIKPRLTSADRAEAERIAALPDAEREKSEAALNKKFNRVMGDMPVNHKRKYIYTQFVPSPDFSKMAYVTNELGQIKVWIYDFETGKNRRIYKKEYKLDRIVDFSFPVMAWHPSGMILSFVTERKAGVQINSYNLDEKKLVTKDLTRIDKVISMDYHPQGRQIAMSGVKDGKTDLFIYQVIGNNQEQITNDIYDDLNPKYTHDGKALIFASNRPDDTLRSGLKDKDPEKHTDIFLFHLDKKSGRQLEQITRTPDVSETNPAPYVGRGYSYLAPAEGIYNRYVARIDSTVSHVDTTIHYRYFTVSDPVGNHPVHMLDYHTNHKTGRYMTRTMLNGRPAVLFG
jgi:Tol biopolymer transport system component